MTQVLFIKRAQGLGFSLAQIDELLKLQRGRKRPITVRRIARAKLEEVEAKITQLARVRDGLQALISDCEAHCTPQYCPILDALGSDHSATNEMVS